MFWGIPEEKWLTSNYKYGISNSNSKLALKPSLESCFNKSSLNLNSVPTRFRMVGKGSPGFNGISGGSSPTNVNNKQISFHIKKM